MGQSWTSGTDGPTCGCNSVTFRHHNESSSDPGDLREILTRENVDQILEKCQTQQTDPVKIVWRMYFLKIELILKSTQAQVDFSTDQVL